MNKFLLFLSSIMFALTLAACDSNVNYVANNETDNIEAPSASDDTNTIENDDTELDDNVTEDVDGDYENINEDNVVDNNTIDDETYEVSLDNLNLPENPISNPGNLDTSELPLIQLTKEQFDDFLYDLVANPNPEEGIMFLAASVTYEDTIDLKLDLYAGSLEAIWISPIWDLLIRQLYVNSEYQNEPTIIIRDVNGEIISERSEPFSLG